MIIKKEKNGVPFYAPFSKVSFCAAAITTREGGVSKGHLASLNLGTRCGDSEENVRENLRRVAEAVGFDPEKTVLTNQKHTKNVRRVYKEDAGVGILSPRFPEGVDAIITDEMDLPLLAYFADCVPVLFCDRETHAVGVCHSGWRGTVQKIAGAVVREMQKEFGTKPENLYAVIGPHIGKCCFEVDEPVHLAFLAAFPKEGGFSAQRGEKYHIDLTGAIVKTLEDAGVSHIEAMENCTVCESETFFSHRKTGGRRGCFGAVIVRKE